MRHPDFSGFSCGVSYHIMYVIGLGWSLSSQGAFLLLISVKSELLKLPLVLTYSRHFFGFPPPDIFMFYFVISLLSLAFWRVGANGECCRRKIIVTPAVIVVSGAAALKEITIVNFTTDITVNRFDVAGNCASWCVYVHTAAV